jgi:hypothetical protein
MLSPNNFEPIARKIKHLWDETPKDAFKIAALCKNADNAMKRGYHHKLITAVGFSKTTFSKFVSIADERRFRHRALRRKLPNNYSALYAIRNLTDYQILSALEDGAIQPHLLEQEIVRWLAVKSDPKLHLLEKLVLTNDKLTTAFQQVKEIAAALKTLPDITQYRSTLTNKKLAFWGCKYPAFYKSIAEDGSALKNPSV